MVVFQFRVCSLEYFMDSCSIWELTDIIQNLPYMDRNLWETARLQAFMVARVGFGNQVTQQDICSFKWEDEETKKIDPTDIEISTEDINRLKELSKQFENAVWQEIG